MAAMAIQGHKFSGNLGLKSLVFHGNVGIRKALKAVSRMRDARVGGHRRGSPRNTRDWKDVKTEIVKAIATAGYTCVTDMGTALFQLAGSGDHSEFSDEEVNLHFGLKEWSTQLLSIRSQITKSTLDSKCEEYQALSSEKKAKLRDCKVMEWFSQSNTRVIKSLRDHLLPKMEKGGPKSAQLRQLFMTAQMTTIIDGDHTEIDLNMAERICDMPVVKLWADILALFECKGRSKSVLELQDVLEPLPAEMHHKMLPASRTIALRRTSKTMGTAVEKAHAVVQARRGIYFPHGRGLLDRLNSLNAWCKVTVLSLKDCRLGEGGGWALAETLRVNTTLTSLKLGANGLGEGGGRTLADTLRVNTTLTSLILWENGLGEGGGRALAEAIFLFCFSKT